MQRYGIGTADTVWVRDTVHTIIPASVGESTFDSVAVVHLPIGDSLTVTSTDGKAKAVIKRVAHRPRDGLPQAGYRVQVLTRSEHIATPVQLPCVPQRELVPQPQPYVPWYIKLLIAALIAALIFALIRR